MHGSTFVEDGEWAIEELAMVMKDVMGEGHSLAQSGAPADAQQAACR